MAAADADVAASRFELDSSRANVRLELLSLFASWYVAVERATVLERNLGRTRTLMLGHLAGFVINGVLDYALVFGRFGFASHGIAGAAIATVVAPPEAAAARDRYR